MSSTAPTAVTFRKPPSISREEEASIWKKFPFLDPRREPREVPFTVDIEAVENHTLPVALKKDDDSQGWEPIYERLRGSVLDVLNRKNLERHGASVSVVLNRASKLSESYEAISKNLRDLVNASEQITRMLSAAQKLTGQSIAVTEFRDSVKRIKDELNQCGEYRSLATDYKSQLQTAHVSRDRRTLQDRSRILGSSIRKILNRIRRHPVEAAEEEGYTDCGCIGDLMEWCDLAAWHGRKSDAALEQARNTVSERFRKAGRTLAGSSVNTVDDGSQNPGRGA